MNIFNLLARIMDTMLSIALNLFPNPNTTVITNIESTFDTFRDYIADVSFIFPANQMLLILGFIITIEVSLFSYRLIKLALGYVSGGLLRD